MAPAPHPRPLRIAIGILLTATDLLTAFFLVLGGLNATVSHPVTGYVSVAAAPLLLFLSSGIWTKSRLKLIIRLFLYAGTFVALSVSTIVLVAAHAVPVSDNSWVMYLALGLFLAAVFLSAVYLRLIKKMNPAAPGQSESSQ
jgi:hypothetical protein